MLLEKKPHGLSAGNLLGSNIFDLLVPVGIGASISELTVENSLLWFDLPFLFIVSAAVLFFFFKKKGLQRIEAYYLIGAFVIYASLKFIGL